MRRRFLHFITAAMVLTILPAVPAFSDQSADAIYTAAADLARGRTLYETTCEACHSANVHWRDKRIADTWPALLREVGKWQRNAGQRWGSAEINDVAAYLNDRFYHLPCPSTDCAAKEAALSTAR
jgi:mono/diheme cytochrome c family protein